MALGHRGAPSSVDFQVNRRVWRPRWPTPLRHQLSPDPLHHFYRHDHRWRNRGRDSGRQPFRQFCQRIDAAQASTARDYLQAVRRSVIEPTVTTKTTTRPGPDGQPVTETVKTVSPPDIKGALWWLERRLPALFGRRLEHAGRIDSTHDREKQRPLEILIVDPMTPQQAAAYEAQARGEGLGRPEHAGTAAAGG